MVDIIGLNNNEQLPIQRPDRLNLVIKLKTKFNVYF